MVIVAMGCSRHRARGETPEFLDEIEMICLVKRSALSGAFQTSLHRSMPVGRNPLDGRPLKQMLEQRSFTGERRCESVQNRVWGSLDGFLRMSLVGSEYAKGLAPEGEREALTASSLRNWLPCCGTIPDFLCPLGTGGVEQQECFGPTYSFPGAVTPLMPNAESKLRFCVPCGTVAISDQHWSLSQ